MKRPSFEAILAARLSRRTLLSRAAAGAGLAACARIPTAQAGVAPKLNKSTFKGIAPQSNLGPVHTEDPGIAARCRMARRNRVAGKKSEFH